MYNQEGIPIELRKDDAEGNHIQENGILCHQYQEELFQDEEAMIATSSEDNMNSSVELAETEIVALGKIHQLPVRRGSHSRNDSH